LHQHEIVPSGIRLLFIESHSCFAQPSSESTGAPIIFSFFRWHFDWRRNWSILNGQWMMHGARIDEAILEQLPLLNVNMMYVLVYLARISLLIFYIYIWSYDENKRKEGEPRLQMFKSYINARKERS
jgi:hypothetical protein